MTPKQQAPLSVSWSWQQVRAAPLFWWEQFLQIHTHMKEAISQFFTVSEHKQTITCPQGVDKAVSQSRWVIDYSPAAEISGSFCNLNSFRTRPLIDSSHDGLGHTRALLLFQYLRLVIYHLLPRRFFDQLITLIYCSSLGGFIVWVSNWRWRQLC